MTCQCAAEHPLQTPSQATERCGPCHNFGLEGLSGYGQVVVSEPFEDWKARVSRDIERAGNMATYRSWLHALTLRSERGRNAP